METLKEKELREKALSVNAIMNYLYEEYTRLKFEYDDALKEYLDYMKGKHE